MYMVEEFFWTILDAIVTKSTMSSEKEPPGHQDLYNSLGALGSKFLQAPAVEPLLKATRQ